MSVLLTALVNVGVATQVAEGRRGDEKEVACTVYIVAYLPKARTVEVGKQPLLANESETTLVSKQRPRNRQRNNVRC
jgi:hypothetical protein